MSIDKKPWERPWTTQEMIDNASNWNLAGDAGLLKYLEEFSDKMLSKVKDTNERLNDLIDSAEETSLALNNATNRFMGLRNTQFIESRVYEDDETLPIKNTEKEEKPKPTEAERLEEMKQAIVNGLDIIDKYYEKVEIPESDSEDDSSEPNIVYEPVDPYSDRPLPYVIGTAEWHKYWHVGLGHSSSDSEIEKEEEEFSESESEQDVQVLPIRREQTQVSDSESEDYSKNKMSRPVANSTFNDQTTKNMFDSSSDSETGSLPPQVNTVNSNFAEELAAKLGKVESNIEVEVNTKPIKKPPTSNIPGGLFSDEPPPLDNDDIFVTNNSSDLFSGGNGLFDDDEDFWNTKPSVHLTKPVTDPVKKPVENKDLFAEENDQDDIFNSKSNISETKSEKPVKKSLGLFDDDDYDDNNDNIFNTSSIAQIKKPASILNDEPPELESTKQLDTTKKPVGGVSILGPNVLLNSKIFQKRATSSSDSDNDSEKSSSKNSNKESVKAENNEVVTKLETEPKKLPSLFDDSSLLFTDDIFANSSSKKFSSKLFEADVEPTAVKSEPKKSSIFDEDCTDDLFSNKDKIDAPKMPDIEVSKTSKKSKSLSLFDDNNSDDDLFASITNKKGHSLFDPNPPSLDTNNSRNKSKTVNLFDPNPPELDDTDNKSENQFSDDPASYGSMNAGRAFLYDTEPPMLSNESSGISRDQSTRLESEDSSFYPYLTSSRRHSDIFQDTQTADSLLTTRNKISFAADSTEKSNLSGIPEIDSMTKIDITASGNESSLLNDESSVFQENLSTKTTESIKPAEKPSIAQKPTSLNKTPEEKTSLFDDIPKKPNVFNEENLLKTNEKSKSKNVFVDSDSDDDLFSNKSSGSKNSSTSDINNSSTKNKNIFESDLFSEPNVDLFKKDNNQNTDSDIDTKNKENDNKKFNYEQNLKSDEDIKIDPKKSLSFEKNTETEKSAPTKEEPDGEVPSCGTSPGKLKHNLNINLAALLPGASPPRKNLEKSVSLDSSESQNQSSTEEASAKQVVKSAEIKQPLEKSISFESPVEHNEILPSAVKERAKIPVKRRPSTRRARQEAIRKSAADLKLEDAILEHAADSQNKSENILNITNNNNNLTENKPQNIKIEAEEKIYPLSPSTDEEDFPTIIMPQEKDLSDNFTESSLFGKAPIISPVEVSSSKDVSKKKSIDNKDDDLFDILKMPPQNLDLFGGESDLFSSTEIKKTPNIAVSHSKGDTSIFSSSDSENDLFSTPKSDLKKPVNRRTENILSSPDDDLFKPASKVPYDDLFKADDIFSKKKTQTKTVVTKKSLFDDDDDDDIFGGSSYSSSLPKSTASVSNAPSSSNIVKKPIINKLKKMPVDAVEDILDPLEALKK